MKLKKLICTAAVVMGMAAMSAFVVSADAIPTSGTGTVVENTTTDSTQREFFTIKTADGNVFYIVVDKEKTGDNVYLLTPVTEESLKSLAESAASSSTGTTSASSSGSSFSNLFGSTSSTASTTTVSSASGSAQTKATGTMSSTSILLVLGVVFAVGLGGGYYFKIYKPKHKRIEDEGDYQDEYEDEPDADNAGEEEADEEESAPEPPRRPSSKSPVQTEDPPEADADEDDAPGGAWKAPAQHNSDEDEF